LALGRQAQLRRAVIPYRTSPAPSAPSTRLVVAGGCGPSSHDQLVGRHPPGRQGRVVVTWIRWSVLAASWSGRRRQPRHAHVRCRGAPASRILRPSTARRPRLDGGAAGL